jgi:ferredoxin
MRITTDTDKCVGAGQCVYSAPAIFDQDEDAIVMLLDGSPDSSQLDLVRAAVDRCPSGALGLVEDRAGEPSRP